MNYYGRYYRNILRTGCDIAPRGQPTKAVFNASFSFTPGTCWRRKHDNPAIGLIEGLQFIAGTADKQAIAAAAPRANLDLFGPLSFYGPRSTGQFARIIEDLRADPTSRRAVLTIMHHDDSPSTLPCTTSIQFYKIEFSLNMIVTMRSSDAVWGLPYDMIQFGMVHLALANCLGARTVPGAAVVNMGNAHIYLDHQVAENNWWMEQFCMPQFSEWWQYKEWAYELTAQHLDRQALMYVFGMKKPE